MERYQVTLSHKFCDMFHQEPSPTSNSFMDEYVTSSAIDNIKFIRFEPNKVGYRSSVAPDNKVIWVFQIVYIFRRAIPFSRVKRRIRLLRVHLVKLLNKFHFHWCFVVKRIRVYTLKVLLTMWTSHPSPSTTSIKYANKYITVILFLIYKHEFALIWPTTQRAMRCIVLVELNFLYFKQTLTILVWKWLKKYIFFLINSISMRVPP